MMQIYYFCNKETALQPDISLNDAAERVKRHEGILWVDFLKPSEEELLTLQSLFDFHPLCIEDCMHPQDVPKMEEYRDHLFLVLHAIKNPQKGLSKYHRAYEPFLSLELDAFLGERYLITVHDEPLQSIRYIEDNIHRGGIIHKGAVPLAHALFDAMVDLYLPVLESIEQTMQLLEEVIEQNPNTNLVKDFFSLHRAILSLKLISSREQEVFYWLGHRDISFISGEAAVHFRDIYDHLLRIANRSQANQDILSGILNIHLSLASNRMNDVMKVLTVFTAVLLPLTLVTGIYGMNFYIPETHYHDAYFVVLAVMLMIVIGMTFFFRSRKWF